VGNAAREEAVSIPYPHAILPHHKAEPKDSEAALNDAQPPTYRKIRFFDKIS
jgi:hypothetical protein